MSTIEKGMLLHSWTIGIQLAWANHHWIVGKNMDIKPIWNRLTMCKVEQSRHQIRSSRYVQDVIFFWSRHIQTPFYLFTSLTLWEAGGTHPALGVGWPPAARQGWWRPVERWRWSHACGSRWGEQHQTNHQTQHMGGVYHKINMGSYSFTWLEMGSSWWSSKVNNQL